MAKFISGDRVAWHHGLATQHAAGSILLASSLGNWDGQPVPCGTVIEAANALGSWWVVQIDPEHLEHPRVKDASATHLAPECLTLTSDELVKITQEE